MTTTAVSESRVRHDPDKTWIPGIHGFNASQYASSVHGAQATVAQALGEAITYDQLLCYSGFAFRVQFHKECCPSAGHPGPGYTCISNSNRAVPRTMQVFEAAPWSAPQTDRAALQQQACAAIKNSIDRGIPVHYGSEEDGLIIGYADGGRRWWCVHPYYKQGREAFWHDQVTGFGGGKWPWGIVVYTDPKPQAERVSDGELTRAALAQAVDMWKTEKRDAYFCGEAAYEHWIQWLTDVEAGKIADPKGGMQGNGWCFDVLVHSRKIAAAWLKEIAPRFDPATREQLLVAADHYTKLVDACMKDIACTWDLAPSPDHYGDWTSAKRQPQIARLRSARTHDAAAIAALEAALSKMQPLPKK